MIVVAGTLAAMALVAVAIVQVPAIEAANGHGSAGTILAGYESCERRGPCLWWGTFQPLAGAAVPHVIYNGTLPPNEGPGSSVPAIRQSGNVYPVHDTGAWISDLLWMVLVGAVVGLLLWISPLGLGRGDTAGAVV